MAEGSLNDWDSLVSTGYFYKFMSRLFGKLLIFVGCNHQTIKPSNHGSINDYMRWYLTNDYPMTNGISVGYFRMGLSQKDGRSHLLYPIPSGKLLHNYGKSTMLIGISIING